MCAHVQESEKEKNLALRERLIFFSWPQRAFFPCITDVTRDHPWFESQKVTHTRKRFFIMPWALDLT